MPAVRPAAPSRGAAPAPSAFLGGLFGGGGAKSSGGGGAGAKGGAAYRICIDCGYLLSEDDFKVVALAAWCGLA